MQSSACRTPKPVLMKLEKVTSRVWVMGVVTFLSLTSTSLSVKTESAPSHHIHCLHFVRCRLVATWWWRTSGHYYLVILAYFANSLPPVFPAFVTFRFHIPFCISSNFFNFLLACVNLFRKLGSPCQACFLMRSNMKLEALNKVDVMCAA